MNKKTAQMFKNDMNSYLACPIKKERMSLAGYIIARLDGYLDAILEQE